MAGGIGRSMAGWGQTLAECAAQCVPPSRMAPGVFGWGDAGADRPNRSSITWRAAAKAGVGWSSGRAGGGPKIRRFLPLAVPLEVGDICRTSHGVNSTADLNQNLKAIC